MIPTRETADPQPPGEGEGTAGSITTGPGVPFADTLSDAAVFRAAIPTSTDPARLEREARRAEERARRG
jgi:hypothetical protein